MLLLHRNVEKMLALEIRRSGRQIAKRQISSIPSFDLGLRFLGIDTPKNEEGVESSLRTYADGWFEDPKKYLRPQRQVAVNERGGFLTFPSVLNNSEEARFKYNPQPADKIGRKVAVIHIMHWNGRLRVYDPAVAFMRNVFLPVSTLIFIPAGRCLNPGIDGPVDWDMASPNIGKTIFRTRQDIQDLQNIARYLKEELGYTEVGMYTYSVGSLYGMLASMMSPELFDFAVFQTIADDSAEALMEGTASRMIADKINGNIDLSLLQKLWSVISMGSYSDYFSGLPKATRVVQCEYDFVFGRENVNRINKKLTLRRPDIIPDVVPVTHTSIGYMPWGAKIMWDNLGFIYNNTAMKTCKRARLFR